MLQMLTYYHSLVTVVVVVVVVAVVVVVVPPFRKTLFPPGNLLPSRTLSLPLPLTLTLPLSLILTLNLSPSPLLSLVSLVWCRQSFVVRTGAGTWVETGTEEVHRR